MKKTKLEVWTDKYFQMDHCLYESLSAQISGFKFANSYACAILT